MGGVAGNVSVLTSSFLFSHSELIRWCSWYFIQRSYVNKLRQAVEGIAASSPGNASTSSPPGFGPTPPYSTNSAQSGVQGTAPSPASSASSGGLQNGQRPQGQSISQSPQHLAPNNLISVSPEVIRLQGKLVSSLRELQHSSHYATRLSMNGLRKYFPRTFDVCSGDNDATGTPLCAGRRDDGVQVDIEACVRGEGEWAWPLANGEDVPHAVGFGRSLLWEFGAIHVGGYRGYDGAWKNEDGTSFRPTDA